MQEFCGDGDSIQILIKGWETRLHVEGTNFLQGATIKLMHEEKMGMLNL